ncbi:MAG: phage tail assembly chaperone [Mesorhizobium sp.]|nr:MAG: phage tail assembly chaperone [Mesorhizobium sp.]
MRLANDIIAIPHGPAHAVRLRPSLRAAVRLHAEHDLRKLVDGIGEGHLGMIADIILAGTDAETGARVVNKLAVRDLAALVEPLSDFAFALLGVERKQAEAAVERADKTPDTSDWIGPHLERLFEIGTGWLGWSPADTWAATPTEIMIAQRGLIARLKAVNGVKDDDQAESDPQQEISPQKVKQGLATLRVLAG